ncbi:TonB-dependent receptor [Formosa sp. A9]|uniref:TonB-dependent receptor n=1 Tax=Formosa sp. A9 TaxID=3442641 RepID=UPI003EB73D7C
MRHLFLVVFSLLVYPTIYAQSTVCVTGTVVNEQNTKGIENVTILINGRYTTTDIYGQFELHVEKAKHYNLQASHVSYISKQRVLNNSDVTNVVIALKEAINSLAEVNINGKSEQRKLKESPLVSQSVSKTFLETNRENSLMQTLKKIPGVSTINIGSGQSKPVIRGLGFNRVVVVQNGIKHEAQQWGGDHGLEIDQYGIENIKIVKGPASLLYGSDAIAGVVDIQPANVPKRNSFSGEVNLLGETNNDLFGVSAGIASRKNHWFYRGRLTYRDYADYKVPTDRISYDNYIFELYDNNLRNTAGQEANASFSLGYKSNGITSETFISNVNGKNGFFANAHGLEVRTSDIDYDASSRDIDLPYHTVNHFKLTNNTSINTQNHDVFIELGYQNNYREEHSEPVPHGYMPKPDNSKEREFNKNTYALNIKDAMSLISNHDIVAGLNLEYQDNNIGGWGFLIPEYNRFTVGGFAYDQIAITDNFNLQAGLRYDWGLINTKSYYDWYPSTINNPDGSTSYVYLQRAQDKTLNFGSFSGSVGLSYIANNTTYKFNVGKSFRMPLANELASDGVNYHMYRYERGNLNLDPESSYQADFEINHDAEKFSFGVSPFINFFDNYIYLNPTSNYYETLQIYEYTQAEVFRFGGEIKASTTLFKKLNLAASAEYVYARQTSGPKKGFTLPFSPPLSGVVSANYTFNSFSWFENPEVMLDFIVTAAQNEIVPPEEITAGYQVLNVSFLSKLKLSNRLKPLALRIKLNNVFNTKYYNHTSFYRLIDVPEPGRNLSLSLTIPF